MTWDKTIVVGYLGRDPELRDTNTGKSVCNFSVAVTRYAGPDNEETIWYNCSAWSNTAENIAKYCRKGDRILLEGNVNVNTWTARDGEQRSQLALQVYRCQFMTTKKERAQNNGGGMSTRFEPVQREAAIEDLGF